MVRSALLLALIVALGGCRDSRADRVRDALVEKGFSDIELTQQSTTRYSFSAVKAGIRCEGTAEVGELSRSYNSRDRVKADWTCGQN